MNPEEEASTLSSDRERQKSWCSSVNPIAHMDCKPTMHENKYPLKRTGECEKEDGLELSNC